MTQHLQVSAIMNCEDLSCITNQSVSRDMPLNSTPVRHTQRDSRSERASTHTAQAFINALPLPALDGGKAFFVLVEQASGGLAQCWATMGLPLRSPFKSTFSSFFSLVLMGRSTRSCGILREEDLRMLTVQWHQVLGRRVDERKKQDIEQPGGAPSLGQSVGSGDDVLPFGTSLLQTKSWFEDLLVFLELRGRCGLWREALVEGPECAVLNTLFQKL